jgi:hypothetical protein
MKGAFDEYLKGGSSAPDAGSQGPTEEDMDSMFGDDSAEESDPLMEALQGAGFDVDEAKLSQIRGILEAKGGEASPFGGMESPEEEAMEGGKTPAAMTPKGKPNL